MGVKWWLLLLCYSVFGFVGLGLVSLELNEAIDWRIGVCMHSATVSFLHCC